MGEDAGELDDEGWSSDDEDVPRTREFALEEYGLDFSDIPEVALVAMEPAKPGLRVVKKMIFLNVFFVHSAKFFVSKPFEMLFCLCAQILVQKVLHIYLF